MSVANESGETTLRHAGATKWYASGMDEFQRAVDTVVRQRLGVVPGDDVLEAGDLLLNA